MQNLLSILANWAQIIAVFLAIIAILIELQQSHLRTRTRSLGIGFHRIWSPILIRADEDFRENIEILYKDRNISNMFILQVVLRNIGNLPIRKAHIVQPISFTFNPTIELLDKPKVVHKNPKNLTINWDFSKMNSASEQVVSLDFDLLNPNEELTLEFVGFGQASLPNVTARIEGVTELKVFDPLFSVEEASRSRRELALVAFWGLVAALLVNAFLLSRFVSGTPVNPLDYFTGLGTGFITAGVIGAIANQIRQARIKMGLRNRLIDDAEHLGLPPSGVIQSGRSTMLRYVAWIFILIVIVSSVVGGIFLILQ